MKLLSADIEGDLSIKKHQQLRRIKEALTIKDLGEVSQRKQKRFEVMFI